MMRVPQSRELAPTNTAHLPPVGSAPHPITTRPRNRNPEGQKTLLLHFLPQNYFFFSHQGDLYDSAEGTAPCPLPQGCPAVNFQCMGTAPVFLASPSGTINHWCL